MANLNGEAHIAAAVSSVLRQTLPSLELILSDDGSTDRSIARAREAAAGDDRLIIVEGGPRSGPAAARNRAIAKARGRWIAVVDSDDTIHPRRFETLLAAAERDGAEIVADDLMVFYEDRSRKPNAFLRGKWSKGPEWVSAADYVRANGLYSSRPPLGYLKPVIRADVLTRNKIAYDESLRIAEDYQLIADLLIGGARMRIYPELLYFYRKHAASISHRLSARDLDSMLAAHDRLETRVTGDADAVAAMRGQRDSLLTARAFTDLVDAIKSGSLPRVLKTAAARPSTLWLLRWPVLDRLAAPRKTAKASRPARAGRIALLSRQRIVGATNGSSTYVLGLAKALTDAGFSVDFIGASPKMFGRWPLFRLRPETKVFATYSVRGGLRTGPIVWSTDPRVALRGGLAAAEILLRKLIPSFSLGSKPADYAIAAPAERADLLYVARHAPAGVEAVVCDYAFLNPLAPYALAPKAPVATIMHDLMSARVNNTTLERAAAPEEIVGLAAADEYALLSLADIVIAIQADEAEQVRARLPSVATVVTPMAATTVASPQPGKDDTLLFVGSNTAANAAGLQWFLDSCWPAVTAARPNAELLVAGSVGRAVAGLPRGVKLLGVVPSLTELYRDAGVVIAPLKTGSGLKIKLVDALAAGKAIVGTTVTVQGVGPLVQGAMVVADDADAFAGAVIRLASDHAYRSKLAAAALTCAENHFSPAACYEPMIRMLDAKLANPAATDGAQGQTLAAPTLSRALATK